MTDPLILAALGCLILAALLGLGAWAFDLVREIDEDELKRRQHFHWLINMIIETMSDDRISPDESSELEWTLHSLLHDYRYA